MPNPALVMLSSMATRSLLAELVAEYGRDGGPAVHLQSAGGVDVARRVEAGEAVDVVVLASGAIGQLIAQGLLVADSRVDVARSGMGVAVRAGSARPAIGSAQALRDALLSAASIGYSTGPSGKYLLSLFERWGVMPQIAQRIVQAPAGVPVATLVARGEVEIGLQQLSELLGVPGIDVLGPLPADIQHVTVFSAAMSSRCAQPQAAHALLAFLADPAAAPCKQRHGMESA